MAEKFATVDDYIDSFPLDVQSVLRELRATIENVVPEAEETISYQMPTVMLDGRYLVYFAAWKHHVGLYPIPPADQILERELAPYRASKGTVRFPLGEPIPYGLVERMVA
jgi:uncharacterized protein YdhG (YjbR/CyaY superfamily)